MSDGAPSGAAFIDDPADAPPPPRAQRRAVTAASLRSMQAAFDLTHSGMSVRRFAGMHALGALFPITAGALVYGWRAMGTIALVCGAAALTTTLWRGIGARGRTLRFGQVLWYALLLALMLPPHLFALRDAIGAPGTRGTPWPILPGVGAVLVIVMWLMGGATSARVHPALVVYLLAVVLFQDVLTPRFALRREHVFTGDLLDAPPPSVLNAARVAPVTGRRSATTASSPTPISQAPIVPQGGAWITMPPAAPGETPALRAVPAAERLESFTGGHEAPERAWLSLESLVRDRLPPLEDLIVAGQPAPIGQASAIATIIGGLFLLYRGLIDYRVPLFVLGSALVFLLLLPIPVVITESAGVWRWLALRDSSVGWPLGVSFANYELMASPLLFCAFFLATSPSVRPLPRRARAIYAMSFGAMAAAFQLYISVAIGPYLALLGVSLITTFLERLFRPRTLV